MKLASDRDPSPSPFGAITVESARAAIAARGRALGAFVTVLPEPERGARGGPLDGVPYALKDVWDTAAIRTTGGSWRHRARIPSRSSAVHAALRASGAVLLGKSNLPDLAFSPESASHVGGVARNPIDPTRTAGGSTGGGAAAVASGMAAFDWGTDFGGSIRTPSACCGVVGLRLSQATWPGTDEHFPRIADRFLSMCGMGPLARTVEGCRAVVRALAPHLRRAEAPRAGMDANAVALWAPDGRSSGDWPTFEAEARALLGRAGVRADPAPLPAASWTGTLWDRYLCAHFDEFGATGEIARRHAIPAVLIALLTGGRLDRRIHPSTGLLLLGAQIMGLTIYRDRERARAEVASLREDFARLWASGRLIVCPTQTVPAPRHGRSPFATQLQAFTKPGNLADATAIALPFGRFDDGLPRSLQILGPPGSEEAVLDLAARLEGRGATNGPPFVGREAR